jgi:hypothetical protein
MQGRIKEGVSKVLAKRKNFILRQVLKRISPLIAVDDTGIEPVTPTMSMWCSTAEPIVRV